MNQVNGTHLKTHGVTATQYKEMFPGAKLIIVSDKHKEAAARNIKSRVWTEEQREAQRQRNKSKKQKDLVSKALKGKSKTEEHKQALKDAKAKEDKIKRAKINGDNRRGKPQPEGWVQNMKITYGGVFRGRAGKRKDLDDMYFRSSWEANYARVLKCSQIDYYFEQKSFLIDLPNGGKSRYTPDFYLPQHDKFIEVKGYWMPNARIKYILFKKQYPNIKIEILDGEKYNQLKEEYKELIKEWE